MEKHTCKVCRKSFPSGRSLGGHMRSHVHSSSSPDTDERAQKSNRSSVTLGAAYGLRENPKKSWRYEWTEEPFPAREKQCRECGKSFFSWKALFGHMKCHSDRAQRTPKQEEEQAEEEQEASWSSGAKKMALVGNPSDNEVSGLVMPMRKPRSRRAAAIPASSSSVSECKTEQEHGAVNLMMLSRDAGHWWGIGSHSFVGSSDKNSMVVEHKEIIKKPKYCKSDSDDESKKGFFKKRSVNDGVVRLGKKPGIDGEAWNYASKIKMEKFDAFDPGFRARESAARFGFDSSDALLMKAPGKGSQFECSTCNKTFHSYQALGGHRAGHKRYRGCPGSSTAGSSENSIETEASFNPARVEEVCEQGICIAEAGNGSSKDLNHHECLLCGKVFASGQALGGHKRSHLVLGANGTGEASFHQTLVIPQQPMAMPDLLDLNVPAIADEESGNTKGSHWWV